MAFFCYDIETLAKESTAVILSAAITHFDFNQTEESDLDEEFASLVENSLYVKFNAKEQIEKYNRIVSKDTLDWWNKQGEFVRDLCFKPSKNDVDAKTGMDLLRSYIKKRSIAGEDNIVWIRGSLDQLATDSLCMAMKVDPIEGFWNFRDVRTAIDLLAETSRRGYCQLSKPFNRDLVQKHIPMHDIALDVLMLKYPK